VTVSDDAVRRWEHGLSDPLLRHLDAYAAVLGSRVSVATVGHRKPANAAKAPMGGGL
jgi:hypothetical protein